jgi:hypothetical protein
LHEPLHAPRAALGALLKAATMAPTAAMHVAIADIFTRAGNHRRAGTHLDSAHKLAPRALVPLYRRGMSNLARGRLDQCVADMTRVITMGGGASKEVDTEGRWF